MTTAFNKPIQTAHNRYQVLANKDLLSSTTQVFIYGLGDKPLKSVIPLYLNNYDIESYARKTIESLERVIYND